MKQDTPKGPTAVRLVKERWYHRLGDKLRAKWLKSPHSPILIVQGPVNNSFPSTLSMAQAAEKLAQWRNLTPPAPQQGTAPPEPVSAPPTFGTIGDSFDFTSPDNINQDGEGTARQYGALPLAIHSYNRETRDIQFVDVRGRLYFCVLPRVRAWKEPGDSQAKPGDDKPKRSYKKRNATPPQEGPTS